jgi:hypothetical protein
VGGSAAMRFEEGRAFPLAAFALVSDNNHK